MTIKDLKRLIEYFADDAEVYIEQPSNDYWKRMLAASPDKVEWADIMWSEYHRSYKVSEGGSVEGEMCDEDEDQPATKQVVLIR